MLTGDKQDTAINIGQACSLIRDDMDLHVVNIQDLVKAEAEEITSDEFDERGRASVKAQIEEGIKRCDAAAKSGVEMGLVIDGRALRSRSNPRWHRFPLAGPDAPAWFAAACRRCRKRW